MDKYKKDLLSDDVTTICNASYKLGEARDTSAVKLLLTKILDPRRSTNLKYKGLCVAYCRTGALKKISGLDFGRKIDQFDPDTTAVNFYLDWAVRQGYLKGKNEIDIYYFK